ncbi:glycerol-3-phosphate dehydrogenase/oxidase [Phytomonospora endophytica]|uniref:Glycerol-3-phosphate dehydrogenase n=1 Tax=Phytomonospora endophytica TaxID=714109 RepID=A0A841FNX5_9ACTN|nr:glycerol-3-phosphate dehydrogenase/oxidase [Phytomonospora endophytica]MBB6039021.1 glycerol-3-phosphate dehydrogenase [Phytomonospora endophytica]GIG69499.1 FAD-dependent oxidoreductase [Phytomonospora endophytica]
MPRDPKTTRNTAARLGPQRRAADAAAVRAEKVDVCVIGGGVTGAGAALDAASRGLSVALVEARDLAAGTSSRSSKLIHGGLRYLEQFEFGLVHEALTERGLLYTRLAPHLVRPVPFLVPLEAPVWQRAYYGAGVALYDTLATALGHGRGMPWHRHLSKRAVRREFPSLRTEGLHGAIRYYDGQVDDARFVLSLARTAASYGAHVLTSTRVVDLLRDAREVVGVRVKDMESGEEYEIHARTVIAATGVWSDDVSQMFTDRPGLRVRASKGIHLLVPRSAINGDAGLILRTEKSVLFVIPWGGHWIIGTTDTDWTLDRAHPAASAADIEYLLDHVNTILDRPLKTSDIEGVYAGLRPLLSGEDEQTSKLSREHAVVEPMLGLMLVAGGKFTTYRVMAADVVDHAARRLGKVRPSRTADIPLVGADGFQVAWADRSGIARRHGTTVGVVEHLLERYGSLAREVLKLVDENPALGVSLTGAPEYLAAEVAYAARAEGALHVDDVMARRTRISIETPHRGTECVEQVADIMAAELDWDAAERDLEVRHYLARVDAERDSQRQPDDNTADAARLGAADVRIPHP